MRKLLNTLYILQEDVYLNLENENIVACKNKNQVFKLPLINVESIVCFNYLGCSPALMGKCAELGISLNFLKPSGEFLARVTGKITGNVLLRRMQYKNLDIEKTCLNLAKLTISAKLKNTISFMEKETRENARISVLIKTQIDLLKENLLKLDVCDNLESVRGYEGESAQKYFAVFDNFIRFNKNEFCFKVRNKRPPLDPVNAMLSYLYVLLSLDVQSACEVVGLDPYIGFLHQDRSGRPSLALDLMEEFRCFIVDRLVLRLINLQQIKPEHFVIYEGGTCEMTDKGRKIILKEWQVTKKTIITHPNLKEKMEIGLLPYVQAQILAKFLRGEIEEYIPFKAIC